jgi:hypothetical protein
MKRANRATVCLLALAIVTIGVSGQTEERTVEDRLVTFAQQLRMGMALASVAAYSPTLGDLRLHAQQLVNLLEGPNGKHFVHPDPTEVDIPGLLVEVTWLGTRFNTTSADQESHLRIADAAGNVRTFLTYALEAALTALDSRRMDKASSDMLRAYAFLVAAYERPCDVPYVPALWTILRAFDLTDRTTGVNEGS